MTIKACERLEKQFEEAKAEVENNSKELDLARAQRQTAVRKLHTIVIADDSRPAAPPPFSALL